MNRAQTHPNEDDGLGQPLHLRLTYEQLQSLAQERQSQSAELVDGGWEWGYEGHGYWGTDE